MDDNDFFCSFSCSVRGPLYICGWFLYISGWLSASLSQFWSIQFHTFVGTHCLYTKVVDFYIFEGDLYKCGWFLYIWMEVSYICGNLYIEGPTLPNAAIAAEQVSQHTGKMHCCHRWVWRSCWLNLKSCRCSKFSDLFNSLGVLPPSCAISIMLFHGISRKTYSPH